MPNGDLTPEQIEKLRRARSQLDQTSRDSAQAGPSSSELSPRQMTILQQNRRRLEGEPVQAGENLLQRAGNVAQTLLSPLGALAGGPDARARAGLAGKALVRSAIIDPAQGLLQIPGLFTDRELPTDRLDDFIQRWEVGVMSNAEQQAMDAGLSAEDIADAQLVGDMVGFLAPTVASLKAAGLALRAPVRLRSHITQGHLVEDLTAGVIFGAALREGRTFEDRMKHTLEESAAFGVGRLIVAGLAFPFKASRLQRARRLIGEERVDDLLRKIETGGRVAIREDEALPLSQLLSEEDLISNSLPAQIIMQETEREVALVQGIIDSSEAGVSSGVVRNIGEEFTEVASMLDDFRNQFPNLSFDTVKRGDVFDVHFGTQGLSNTQKAQFKLHGRFEGQILEKNGSFYEYVDELQDGRLKVKTSDGQVTTLKPDGVSETFGRAENVPAVGPAEALYSKFRSEMDDIFDELAGQSGLLPESEIIRGIREGTLTLSENARRVFDRGGAIMHPEELGFNSAGFKYRVVPRQDIIEDLAEDMGLQRGTPEFQQWTQEQFIYDVVDSNGDVLVKINGEIFDAGQGRTVANVGDIHPVNMPFADYEDAWKAVAGEIGPGHTRDLMRQMVWDFRSQGFEPNVISGARATGARAWSQAVSNIQSFEVERVMKGDSSLQQFVRRYLISGNEDGNLLPTPGVASFEDVFEAWAKMEDLPVDAPDFETMKTYFAQRVRQDFWNEMPEADKKIFNSIRNEFFELAEEGDIPFSAMAHNKGFSVSQDAEGLTTLKDLMTGREMTFGSQRIAREALANITRGEGKDVLGGMIPKGMHGISGMTGGFDPTDGYFVMSKDGHVPAREFVEDMPLLSNVRNLRDSLIEIERATGMPLFSKVFDRGDEAVTRMRNELEPWAFKIEDIWKPLGRDQRIELAEWWQRIEGEELGLDEAVRRARRAGLSDDQINAFREARNVFDAFFELSGIDGKRYINQYYSRMRPYAAKNGRIDIDEIYQGNTPPEVEFWAEMVRTGELANVELDPEIVMQKYARSLFFKREVSEVYEQMRTLVKRETTPKVGDLPKEEAASLIRQARDRGLELGPDDPILQEPIRDVLSEYMNVIRGAPTGAQQSSRRFFRRLFDKIGVDVDEKVLDQYTNAGLASMYGAAMGLRPALTARNAVQTIWNHYTRLGAKHGGEAMRRAFTKEGFDEAVEALAIRNITSGLPAHDAIFERFVGEAPIEGSGPISNVIAFAMSKAMRLGKLSSDTSRKMLHFYSTADDMNRAWSYHWQKLHTDDVLQRFEAGDIDWDTFVEEGLPFFKGVTKKEFARRYNKFGRENALRWIGKQGSDETHFIYGVGAQPAWMQRPLGRFAGMFGTWPIWQAELYFSRMNQGTFKQQAAFFARNLALVGAFANMTIQSGIQMANWIAPASIASWSGGPFVDHLVELKRVIDAPLDQKADAMKNLAANIGRLALPGQVFYTDIQESLDTSNPADAALRLMLGRPVDDYNFAIENIYSRDNRGNRFVYPSTERSLRSLNGARFPQIPLNSEEFLRPGRSGSARPPSSAPIAP